MCAAAIDAIGPAAGGAKASLRRRRQLRPVARLLASAGLLEIGDECVLERLPRGAAPIKLRRRADGQNLAGVHQRDAVAAHRLVHEMGGDEDRHSVIPGQVDEILPERSRATGSTPEVGSSRTSKSGPWIMATANCSRWRTPRGNESGRASHDLRQAEPSEPSRPRAGRNRRWADAKSLACSSRFCRTVSSVVERKGLRHVADAPAGPISFGSDWRPNSLACPSVGGNRPVSIFMVVDLPQPLAPRKPKISPRLDLEAHMIHGNEIAEVLGESRASMAVSPPRLRSGDGISHRLVAARFSCGNRAIKASSRVATPASWSIPAASR